MINRFDGTNFDFWKMQIEDVLFQKSLHQPLFGRDQKPTDMSDEKWNLLDRQALATIRLTLSQKVAFNVRNEKTTLGLIEALSDVYQKPSAANKARLIKSLVKMRMSSNESVAEYLNRFNSLSAQIDSLSIKIEEEVKALLLLAGLPDSWDSYAATISNAKGKDALAVSDVVSALLDEESRRGIGSSSSKQNDNLLNFQTRGRSQSRGRSQFRDRSKSRPRSKSRQGREKSFNRSCWTCGKPGHIARFCKVSKVHDEQQDERDEVNFSNHGENTDLLLLATTARDDSWVVDTGASFHATGNRSLLRDYVENQDLGKVYMGDANPCEVCGVGNTKVTLGNGIFLPLNNVRYVPKLTKNLVSIGQLDDLGYKTEFANGSWKISKGAMTIAKGKKVGSLYLTEQKSGEALVSSESVDANLWHKRLGHISERGLKVLVTRQKLPKMKEAKLDFCEDCVLGKQSKVSFSTTPRAKKMEKLELVHTDLWGPAQVNSMAGSQYFLTFIDDATHFVWTYFLKHKSDVFEKFKEWRSLVENESGCKLKCLRSDNGGEFCSKEFDRFCVEHGIKREKVEPKCPQHNGVAERINRTLVERARSMRIACGLPKVFWVDAIHTATYLVNRSPHKSLDSGLPIESWRGKEANMNHLKVFGCLAYAHVENSERSKLDPKSRKCIFLGYSLHDFGYRLWDLEEKKVIRSKNMIFNEKIMYKDVTTSKTEQIEEEVEVGPVEPQVSSHESSTRLIGDPHSQIPESFEDDVDSEVDVDEDRDVEKDTPSQVVSSQVRVGLSPKVQPGPRRSSRPNKGKPYVYPFPLGRQYFLLLSDSNEPESFEEVSMLDESANWYKAMQDEITSLHENDTWELVPPIKERKVVQCKWVYKIKEEPHGKKRFKARLVAKGFQQKAGVDFTEIFAPVVKISTIRLVINLAASLDLHIEQMDVKTAFLHGDLEEEIYMSQPQGFEVKGKEDFVCRLKKSLYGLKQAPRQWYLRFDEFALKCGFYRCNFDHCCYIMKNSTSMIILLLYVDDMLLVGSNLHSIEMLKQTLAKEFAMKDLGEAKKILGIQIKRVRSEGKIFLSQEDYLKKVLKRFNMENCKSVSTPLAPHFKLSKQSSPSTMEEAREMSKVPYSSAVGSLMYAMICTRPDIAYAVGVVSRFMSCPGRDHWNAVKWILRYLEGTKSLCLCYAQQQEALQGFADADMAGDLDGRRSTSGYVFMLNGGLISWVSKLQKIVALSTTEAEYIACTEACKELVWLQGFLRELGFDSQGILYSDSQSAIHLGKNAAFHSRTKHIDVRYHFIRSLIESKDVILEKISTKDNIADMLTKVVTPSKHWFCVEAMSLVFDE